MATSTCHHNTSVCTYLHCKEVYEVTNSVYRCPAALRVHLHTSARVCWTGKRGRSLIDTAHFWLHCTESQGFVVHSSSFKQKNIIIPGLYEHQIFVFRAAYALNKENVVRILISISFISQSVECFGRDSRKSSITGVCPVSKPGGFRVLS